MTGIPMIKITISLLLSMLIALPAYAVESITLLRPARVFDGDEIHSNWIVLVRGSTILYVGVADEMPDNDIDQILVLDGQTLLPGLIEGHSHILLHPYNETVWNDQVLTRF
jgi:imidazolonepropionase-like amidohydrolase